ncbi:Rv3654c family TadE-like protein [Nocardia sp. NBC_00416]|uniref:Rv3654c family TadE-like protein n=1 Tax=Nocardia sp. NBC_00416 TaxID=2975991 RepID=UPI002E1EA0FC
MNGPVGLAVAAVRRAALVRRTRWTARAGWQARPQLPSREDGSATVTACLALAALLVSTVLIMNFGAVVVGRHRAQTAADLAALAAAGELRYGAEAGCAAAERLGRQMKARVAQCEIAGWDAVILIEEKVPMGPFGMRSMRAVARAGPVEEAK